nr:hypothetical protein [Tanacetum cinerariifolium]
MTTANARIAIQEMVKHSKKWHDGMSTRTKSTKTTDGLTTIQAQLNNLGREIKKVNEKVYVAQVGCELCKGPHYTKDFPLKEEGKTLEEAYYTQFGVPFPQGGQYRATSLRFYQRNNANPSYQERRQSIEESLSKFLIESVKRHEENSNMIKENRASTNDATRNQGALIKALEIQIGQMSKVLEESGSRNLPSSTEANLRDHARLRREALILNRSLDHLYGDYIELDDLSKPLELRRNQVDDLKPIIKEGKLVDEPIIDRVETSVENMDAYRDEEMGDIIVGRPYFKEACIKAIQFDGMITISKGNDSVTYQMAQPQPRFKHLTNAQCNKMRPLLKVSTQDELKGISHPSKSSRDSKKEF